MIGASHNNVLLTLPPTMADAPSESRASSTAFATPEVTQSPVPAADGDLASLAFHLDEVSTASALTVMRYSFVEQEEQRKFARLDFLLKKSSLYSSILADRIAKQREEAAAAPSVEVTEPKGTRKGKKRNRSGEGLPQLNAAKRAKVDEIFPQPPQIRATLKPYQVRLTKLTYDLSLMPACSLKACSGWLACGRTV